MKEKFFESLNYIVLMALIIGQCIVGSDFMIGQSIYLFANTCAVARVFALKRPLADKVKECVCMAITIGLIGIKVLGGIIS